MLVTTLAFFIYFYARPFQVLYKSILTISLVFPLSLMAAEAVITLNNGDQLTADITQQDETNLYLTHPVLGDLIIAKDKVEHVSETEIAEVETVVAKVEETKPADVAPTDNGLFGTGLLQNWKRRFDLGIAGSAGKSSNSQINLGFTADFEDERSRISHKTAYFRAESEGETSDHSFYSLLNKDWLTPNTPWIKFANGRIDLDEFKDWDYRLNASGGVGYEFINSDTFLLVGRSGLGFSQTFGGEREEFTPEGSLGIESKWQISDYQSLKAANTYYPSLDNVSDFRNISTLDWTLDLNTFAGMALKLGLSNEYDSNTDGDTEKNDFKYTVSLAWTL